MSMAPPLFLRLSRLILLLSVSLSVAIAAADARAVPVDANFSAAIYNAAGAGVGQSFDDYQSRFFFSILHTNSRTPVWTATATSSTMFNSIVLALAPTGLALYDPSAAKPDDPAWSTPRLREPVAALRLLDTGELALIDSRNTTLWSSFDRPTDTLLPGQPLLLGSPLTSSASDHDLSPGVYRLVLTPNDALLQWATNASSSAFLTYWSMSSDPAALQDSNQAVASMAVNSSGLYLFAANGRDTVYRLHFPSPPASKAESRILKLYPSGRLRAVALTAAATVPTVWAAPANDCDLPLPCPSLSLCTPDANGSTCTCPDAFSTYSDGGCEPADGSALPAIADTCAKQEATTTRYSYVSLGAGIGYPPTKFAVADTSGDELPACRDLCSANCSCLGFFYKNTSRSCFLLRNRIGSVFRAGADVAIGFIKTLPSPQQQQQQQRGNKGSSSSLSLITIVFGIVFPTVAAALISFLLYAMLRRRRPQHLKKKSSSSWLKLTAMLSSSRAASSAPSDSEDLDEDVLIPGLPTRFTYADLDASTDGFRWQIGSGGFGSVFRGELPDRSTVAVKRMNGLGTQGRREFLTEIAVIGNVHHVNLVKLRGFCAEGAGRQLLVYEYMNRGSLDQTLFRIGTLELEWAARLRVCVGAARGLAYLHAGCDRKILHCDVKPENILLDDHGGVKIADFGLAKLMSPEQSGLFTTMRGTRGYLAPEWLMNAPITDKADVYSFGMVLLEIVRGRKNSKKQWEEEQHQMASGSSASSSSDRDDTGGYFPALALELHEQGRYEELVDPRLEGRADVAQVERVVRVALCCLHEDAALRPSMTVVSAMLDGSMEAGEPRAELLRYLRMYGRGLVDLRPAAAGWMDQGKAKDAGGGVSSSWSPPSCVSAQQLSGPR
ncbi:unnamed protein product [Miscanthus lutarioriparius]|uniref:Receptor-like serine/threonine-protein kinase n=1 Tax=Miscanthus lutarioriparius TaxID=422564 RepID=A0A811RHP1_9POAL|nr:unnamed protein product [Miscanthus lutarioriparius]